MLGSAGFWPWLGLAGLGAFHGVNPAMGWLFAVALGLQRQSRGAVLWALLPITIGHAGAVGAVLAAAVLLRSVLDLDLLRILSALLLIGFGVWRLVARHTGRAGMQVGFADLALWSFLMATAHGAGIMLLPIVLALPGGAPAMAGHEGHLDAAGLGSGAAEAIAALGVHTAAMLAVTAAVAVVVYDWVGLAFLRRGWINLDRLWSLALIALGVLFFVPAVAGVAL